MSSRSLFDLCPQTGVKAQRLIADAGVAGIRLLVTSTYRSFREQQGLYDQGRSAPGKIVTNAKPGESYHNVRRALDVAILKSDGTLDWNWMASAEATALWERLAEIGEAHGLAWGGRWKRPDRPHFEDQWCSHCKAHVGPRSATHFGEAGECLACE